MWERRRRRFRGSCGFRKELRLLVLTGQKSGTIGYGVAEECRADSEFLVGASGGERGFGKDPPSLPTLTPALTHTHSLTHSLTHSPPTHSPPTHSLPHSLTHPLTHDNALQSGGIMPPPRPPPPTPLPYRSGTQRSSLAAIHHHTWSNVRPSVYGVGWEGAANGVRCL